MRSVLPPPSPQRVLITGAGGFLGSALASRLLADGHRVLGVDVGWSEGRLADHPGLERHTADVRDERAMRALVAESDRVLHMAAVAGVHDYQTRPYDVLDVNILGTRSVLLACRDLKRPVVFASSSEAFGKNPLPLAETSDTWLGPSTQSRWCYATSKVVGEHFAWAMLRHGLVAASVRYFNAYGPLLDAPGQGRVISQFIGAVQRGEPLKLVDNGEAVRCFCYIDDAVDATVGLLFALEAESAANGRPFNVGRAEPVTMAQLAASVIRLTGHRAGTEPIEGNRFFGAGFEEIPHRVPDTRALEALTGFKAEIPLEDGLRRTLDHWGLLIPDAPAPPPPRIQNVRPQYAIDANLVNAWIGAALTGRTTNAGRHTAGLEAELSAFFGVDGVSALGSGADALNVAVRALGRSGVAILPAWTYVSTLNAVELAGLEPVLVDIDPGTWTMCPRALDAAIRAQREAGAQIAAILPVNVFGVPPDLDTICALAADIPVIYDDAQGVGSELGGARVHPGPAITTWSFHATKVLPGTEGGALFAKDPALRQRCERIRTHGLPPDPLEHIPGFNAKIDELSAASVRHGLARFDTILTSRLQNYHRLRAGVQALGWTIQVVPDGVRPNGQNVVARPTVDVDAAISGLRELGVEARRYFDPPLHRLRRFGGRFVLPHTDALWRGSLSLPLHTTMAEPDLARILDAAAEISRG